MTTQIDIKVSLKETAPCQKEFQVEVPWSVVSGEFETVYQELKRVARVPGFRIGSAPRDLLERYHGEKAKEEVLDRLVRESMAEALRSHPDLDLVGRPSVSEIKMQPNKPLFYRAQIEVSPQVKVGQYKGIKLKRPQSGVAEKAVEEVLTQLQDSHAQLETVLEPRAAAAGDFLLADLVENTPGKPPQTQKDVVIHLDLEKDPEGLLKALVGLEPGQKRSVDLPEGGKAEIELKALKYKKTLPLDDAFAKSTGPYDTLDALKQAIRTDLERRAEASQRHALETQITEQLIGDWKFDVPPSLVASQARRIVKDKAMELMGQGVPENEMESHAQVLSDQAKVAAVKEVKTFFILRKIASEEKLTATEEEINKRVEELAGRMQKPVEEVRQTLESKEMMEELAWNLIRGKVMKLILKEANIQEVS